MNLKDYIVIALIIALLLTALIFNLINPGGGVLAFGIAVAFGWAYFCWKTRWCKRSENR